MSEMTDRVEDAIRKAVYAQFDIMLTGGTNSLARAAIEAMREPTPDMCRRGDPMGAPHGTAYAEASWRAMIDAALKD